MWPSPISSKLRAFAVLVPLSLAFLVTACGADDEAGRPMPYGSLGEVHPLTVWNNSQFEVREILAVPPPDATSTGEIAIGALALGEHVVVEAFVSGSSLSFVRDKVQGGEALQITTQEPVYVDAPGYTLILWDDGFRLLPPQHVNNPFGGSGDATPP